MELTESANPSHEFGWNNLDLLQRIISASPFIIIRARQDGTILSANPAAAALMNAPIDALMGENLWTFLFPNREAPPFKSLQQRLREGDSLADFRVEVRKNDEDRIISWNISRYNAPISTDLMFVGIDFTERHHIEQELKLKNAAVEATNAGILITDARQKDIPLIYANQSFLQLTGYTKEEIYGKNCRFLQGNDQQQLGRFKIREAINRGKAVITELRNYRKDGSLFWNQVHISPIHDSAGKISHFIGIQTDITERKRALMEEQFLNNVNQTLAQSLNYNETLKLIVSKAIPLLGEACAVYLYDEEKKTLTDLMLAHLDPAKKAIIEKLLNTATTPFHSDATIGILHVAKTRVPDFYPEVPDDELLRSGINPRRLDLWKRLGFESYMAVPLVARNKTLAVIAFAFGKGGRKHTQEDLNLALELSRRASVHIDNARIYGSLQRELKLREDFTSILSHDLKNPISSILMTVSLIERMRDRGHNGGERINRMIESIRNSAKRMENMVHVLLDFAKIATEGLPIQKTVVEAHNILEDCYEMFQVIAQRRDIHLTIVPTEERITVFGDQERLIQALSNLLGNALKFTPPKGTVTMGAKESGQETVFWVSDTGPGIPAKERDLIFQRYWHKSHTAGGDESSNSLGLGLFITQGIVAAHGGKIWVESEEGKGSTFSFAIPR